MGMIENSTTERKDFPADEIDFAALFAALWNGKWLVLAITSVLGALGFLYAYQLPTTFSSSLEIKPIPTYEEETYLKLNNVELFSRPESFSDIASSRLFYISKTGLLNLYIEKLEDRDLWIKSFDEVYSSKKSQFQKLNEYNNFIRGLAYSTGIKDGKKPKSSFRLRETLIHSLGNRSPNPILAYPEITFSGQDKNGYIKTLEIVLEVANEQIKKELLEVFNRKIAFAKTKAEFQLKELEVKIQDALADHEKIRMSRLAFLKEQHSIAKSLGIAKNQIEFKGTMANTPNFSLRAFAEDKESDEELFFPRGYEFNNYDTYYLRGYQFIAEEIRLMHERNETEDFMPERIMLERQIREINQEQTVTKAKFALQRTPIQSDGKKFRAAVADVGEVKITYKNKLNVIIVSSTLLGLFLGLFVLFVKNNMRT